jgi:hypothetical protein
MEESKEENLNEKGLVNSEISQVKGLRDGRF